MMKMKMLQLVAWIALIAVCHAEVPNKPITVNAVAPVAAPPNAGPLDENAANELAEWGEYKAHFKKVYGALEDRYRHNIYFANKEKKAKYEELHRLGLPVNKLELDVFADFTCDELKLPEESQTEWENFKVSLSRNSLFNLFKMTKY